MPSHPESYDHRSCGATICNIHGSSCDCGNILAQVRLWKILARNDDLANKAAGRAAREQRDMCRLPNGKQDPSYLKPLEDVCAACPQTLEGCCHSGQWDVSFCPCPGPSASEAVATGALVASAHVVSSVSSS